MHFEEKGWRGICIEAHQDYIGLLKRNRPGSVVIHCAVGEKDEEEVNFYANARGSLSSLDPATRERFERDYSEYFTGFDIQRVTKRTLNSVFREHDVKEIDILSIDIEGYEVEALQGLDLDRFSPRIFVIESDSDEHKSKLNGILSKHGYFIACERCGNLFYTKYKKDGKKVKNKLFKEISIIHTEHPLDQGGDTHLTVKIDTRVRKIDRTLRDRLSSIKGRVKNSMDRHLRGTPERDR
ncbi:FkbM family methyltransferase [Acidobacteriota bacterium]